MKKIFFIVFFLFLSQNVYSNTWTIKEYKDEFKGESVELLEKNKGRAVINEYEKIFDVLDYKI